MRLVQLEMPSSPHMYLIEVAQMREISGRRDLIERIRWYRDTTGPVTDGNAAFLLRRSLYMLPLRTQRG